MRSAWLARAVAALVAGWLAACGGGGGGGGSPPPQDPVIAKAQDFWLASTGSTWTLDGVDRTQGTPVEYRDRITISRDPLLLGGRLLIPFDASRPLNQTAGPQYRSHDTTGDGIRAWLEAVPTDIALSYVELPEEIRAGSYKAFERTETAAGVSLTLRIDVNVVGFEPLSLPGVAAARALKTVHTFTATATEIASGRTATGVSTLAFWYVKGIGLVKQQLTDPDLPAPGNTITEELAGTITSLVRSGVVGDLDLLSGLAPVLSTLNIGRPGVASDGSGYLIAAREVDSGLYAHVRAVYIDASGRPLWANRVMSSYGLASAYDEAGPVAVAWDGAAFWVVTLNDRPLGGGYGLVRQRVTPNGTVLDGPAGTPLVGGAWPALASDGTHVLVVYGRYVDSNVQYVLYATLYGRDGNVIAPERQLAVLGGGSHGFASVAFSGGRYLVSFERDAPVAPFERGLWMTRLDAGAALIDSSPLGFSAAPSRQSGSAVAPWAGDFAALWIDGRDAASAGAPELAVYGSRVRGSDGLVLDSALSNVAGIALDPTPTSRFGTAAAANANHGLLLWTAGAYPTAPGVTPGIHGHFLATGQPLGHGSGYTPDRHLGSLSSPQVIGRLMAPAAATNGTGFLAVWAEVESVQSVRGALVFPRVELP